MEERRAEFQAELDHAASEHAEAQQRLVRGFTAEAKQKAASAYAAYCSLKEALAQLDQTLEGKRQSLAAAEEHGQQTAARTRLTEIAIELSQAETNIGKCV